MGEKQDSEFMYHLPCENCGSSDANGMYTDGHQFCFSCNTYIHGDSEHPVKGGNKKMAKECQEMSSFDGEFIDLTTRKLRADTCRKFGYFVGKYNGKPCQVAPYCDDDGTVIGQKVRFPDKDFTVFGKLSDKLFGSHLWSAGGKMIVVTEGEIDALTVSQLQDNKWPVVSIPNGAQGAHKAIKANLEYLSSFDKVVFMFDMDEPGRKASEECAKLLPPGKASIAVLPKKDPNQCLIDGVGGQVVSAIWNSKEYRPDGIIAGSDLFDKCVEEETVPEGLPYPWGGLNEKTYGIRTGELVTITSGSGMGKSTMSKELEYYLGVTNNKRVGVIHLEESTKKTGLELMSIEANERIMLNPSKFTAAMKEALFSKTIGNGNFFLYDHFGSTEGDNLLDKMRFMIVSLGCQYIFLDHISIVVSGLDEGDERKTIDRLMTNLRSLVEETGCAMFVISHLKRPEGKGHEEGAATSLSQLRGSHAIAQLSDFVIGLERDQQGDNPNLVAVRVLKNRFSGDTGICQHLVYNKETGRMLEATEVDLYFTQDEQAGSTYEFTQQGEF